jgi:uncharacterized membrane protein
MVQFFKAWMITSIIFFAGDIVWLYAVMNRFLVTKIHHLMNISDSGVSMNYTAAVCAYLLLATALTIFVVIPLAQAPVKTIFLYGAFLGLCIYGVYECTNYATLYNWPLSFLAIDILWGTLWSGLVAVMSVLLIKMM